MINKNVCITKVIFVVLISTSTFTTQRQSISSSIEIKRTLKNKVYFYLDINNIQGFKISSVKVSQTLRGRNM